VTDAVAMIISPRLQQAYRRCVPMFPVCFPTDRRRRLGKVAPQESKNTSMPKCCAVSGRQLASN
jgi:hypothetical protein